MARRPRTSWQGGLLHSISHLDVDLLQGILAQHADEVPMVKPQTWTLMQAVVRGYVTESCVDGGRLPYEEVATEACTRAKRVARLLLQHGADPHEVLNFEPSGRKRVVPQSPQIDWPGTGGQVSCSPKGKSALSLLATLRDKGRSALQLQEFPDSRVVQGNPALSKLRLAHLGELMQTMMVTATSDTNPPCKVSPEIVDMWSNLCTDSSSHDVVVKTKGGDVTVHSVVLSAASPVVAAMLRSGMQEGVNKVVPVDCPREAVQFLLDLVYTGCSSRESPVTVLLPALDVAHAWQLSGVVAMMERALAGTLDKENFGEVAEAALLKNLEGLKVACRKYVVEHKPSDAERQAFPRSVQEWLSPEQQLLDPPPAKRPCRRAF
mmetsp:Transcript_60659/g.112519  ORF Transcript_60659/g.112519 Transcript_60659/m.112519 type:complete len:378 (-) Transcript_60659:40-1173(-)